MKTALFLVSIYVTIYRKGENDVTEKFRTSATRIMLLPRRLNSKRNVSVSSQYGWIQG